MGTTIDDIAWEMAYEDAAREEYEQELIDNALRDISEENVKNYLGKYSDAIEKRIKFCLDQAKTLKEKNYFGSSLILSATAIELIVRFLLLRPLVQGAFLSDEWVDVLSKRIATGRSAKDKNLLPAVLKKWEIDITKRTISNGSPIWETIHNTIWPKRNAFVHQASLIGEQESLIALECANTLMAIVREIAENLGFTLSRTGKWCEIHEGQNKIMKGTSSSFSQSFEPESPFSNNI